MLNALSSFIRKEGMSPKDSVVPAINPFMDWITDIQNHVRQTDVQTWALQKDCCHFIAEA